MNSANEIVRFYGSEGNDDRGRSLAQVQAWPDDLLESVHDFIQWMFPLRERSAFNPDVPVLDSDTINLFRSNAKLKSNLRLSFARMLRFYGFEVGYNPDIRIVRAPNFQERAREWISPFNHNYLRITRILKSLSLLGLEEEARAFLQCLCDIYEVQSERPRLIPPETFRYWTAAVLD
jgi:hypothetical protein